MPVKRMTKMEAVGLLCDIKNELERDLAAIQDREDNPEEVFPLYYQKTRENIRLKIRALEMAGTSMTR